MGSIGTGQLRSIDVRPRWREGGANRGDYAKLIRERKFKMKKIRSEKIAWGTVLSLVLGLTLFALSASAQIEPNAREWKTWVLTSGSQFRLPAPPGSHESKEEIEVLEKLAEQRDAAALDLIKFWDAGAPSYQWNQMTINELKKFSVGTVRGERALALVHVAIYDAMVAAWDSKYAYNRPRPSRLDKDLTTVIPNPHSPSYPIEHPFPSAPRPPFPTLPFPPY